MNKLEVKLLLICLKKRGENQMHNITCFFTGLNKSDEQIISFLRSIQTDGYIRFMNYTGDSKADFGWPDNKVKESMTYMGEITQPGVNYLKSISDRRRNTVTFIAVIVFGVISVVGVYFTIWPRSKEVQRPKIQALPQPMPIAKSKAKSKTDTSKIVPYKKLLKNIADTMHKIH